MRTSQLVIRLQAYYVLWGKTATYNTLIVDLDIILQINSYTYCKIQYSIGNTKIPIVKNYQINNDMSHNIHFLK